MGYPLNPALVKKSFHLLQLLDQGIESTWRIAEDLKGTRDFAYNLRMLLWIASKHPEEFPGLARAHKEWQIKVIEPGLIKSIPKKARGYAEAQVQGLEPAGKPVEFTNPRDAGEVISAWRMHLPIQDAITFTGVRLPLDELTKIHAFVEANQPKLMMLFDEDSKVLIISLRDTSMGEFAWKPPVPPEVEEIFNI